MFKTERSYIAKDKKMLGLINENYSLLLCLQHFDIDFAVDNKTVEVLCAEHGIDVPTFVLIANLYNGFFPDEKDVSAIKDIGSVLSFLKNSHSFYIEDKFPDLKHNLGVLKTNHSSKSLQLVETFLNDYFDEVLEHLRYEDEIAFPYFHQLQQKEGLAATPLFSAKEYRTHHGDIETKLSDLKHLFLKHILINGDLNTKRNFLNALFELESELIIHSIIEEKVLIPLIEKLEKE